MKHNPLVPGDVLHTRQSFARRIHASLRKADYIIERGELPHIKIGQRVLIAESDLTAWLEKNRRGLAA